jgi:hypothetical protein
MLSTAIDSRKGLFVEQDLQAQLLCFSVHDLANHKGLSDKWQAARYQTMGNFMGIQCDNSDI